MDRGAAPSYRRLRRAAGGHADRALHRGGERAQSGPAGACAKALYLAKVTGATLVIAKLDRLSRNAAFLLALRDSGVRFAAVDRPEANDLTVGIMALVAQQEREAISKRTMEALAVAKARGVRLGNPNGAAALRRAGKGGAPLRAAIAGNADRHAQDLAPVVADIRAGGQFSLGPSPTSSTPAGCSPAAAGDGTSRR